MRQLGLGQGNNATRCLMLKTRRSLVSCADTQIVGELLRLNLDHES